MEREQHKGDWDVVIGPTVPWWRPDLKELWHFRDLLVLFIRRDLLAVYKQTVLGPLWQVVQRAFAASLRTSVSARPARSRP